MVTRALTIRASVAIIALAYATFVYLHGSPFAAGSDSSGYLNSARLLARGELTTSARTLPGLTPPEWRYHWQEPLGFTASHLTPRMAPTYSTGLPLHLPLVAPIVGWEKAARAVNVLNVLAAAALLYALARELTLSRAWSLVAVALLWASPLFLYNSLQPLSDALALTWAVAAILCALKSRERLPWAFAAGAAFAVAVLVRPTNLLLALPLLFALGVSWRAWLATVVGGLPGAIWLFIVNSHAFGSPFKTGYGDLTNTFEFRFLVGNLAHFTLWVPLLVSVPVALAALALPWFRRGAPIPSTLPLLASWFGVFAVFYATYYCAGDLWSDVRFLLPGFPAVILAGLLAVRSWRPTPPWLLLGCCLVGQFFLASELRVTGIREQERAYRVATRWLEAHVAPGSVVIVAQLSGAAQFYNELVLVRWDALPPHHLETLRLAAARSGRTIYAALFNPEIEAAQKALPSARWQLVDQTPGVKFFRLLPASP